MHNFKYIIWDFDGTLFNTYPHLASVITEIMKSKFDIHLNMNQVQEWCETSLKFCFGKLISDYNINKSEFQDLFSKNYIVNLETQQPPFPGAKEILTNIKKRGGKNFIVTHRGSITLFKLLHYCNMEDLFEKVITNEDGFPNKPDPASFLHLIDKFQLSKEKVIAVGDRKIDIQTAHAINIKSCYFNPKGKIHELADFNIRNLIELKGILNLH
jgi:HAD superfamily hydrolase (TIGR01549 family)